MPSNASDQELPEIRIRYPEWVADSVDFSVSPDADVDRLRIALDLARRNIEMQTGGPFGAAVFERGPGGRLVAVGVNLVVPHSNSVLHAEMVALMMAEARVGSYSLAAPNLPEHELYTSCEPCAMCLGAVPWSGVRRVVWSATREDAGDIDFDEGPVFGESYAYLKRRGFRFDGPLLRDEGRAVLSLYRERSGPIYNG